METVDNPFDVVFECDLCEGDFYSVRSLRAHRYKVHGVQSNAEVEQVDGGLSSLTLGGGPLGVSLEPTEDPPPETECSDADFETVGSCSVSNTSEPASPPRKNGLSSSESSYSSQKSSEFITIPVNRKKKGKVTSKKSQPTPIKSRSASKRKLAKLKAMPSVFAETPNIEDCEILVVCNERNDESVECDGVDIFLNSSLPNSDDLDVTTNSSNIEDSNHDSGNSKVENCSTELINSSSIEKQDIDQPNDECSNTKFLHDVSPNPKELPTLPGPLEEVQMIKENKNCSNNKTFIDTEIENRNSDGFSTIEKTLSNVHPVVHSGESFTDGNITDNTNISDVGGTSPVRDQGGELSPQSLTSLSDHQELQNANTFLPTPSPPELDSTIESLETETTSPVMEKDFTILAPEFDDTTAETKPVDKIDAVESETVESDVPVTEPIEESEALESRTAKASDSAENPEMVDCEITKLDDCVNQCGHRVEDNTPGIEGKITDGENRETKEPQTTGIGDPALASSPGDEDQTGITESEGPLSTDQQENDEPATCDDICHMTVNNMDENAHDNPPSVTITEHSTNDEAIVKGQHMLAIETNETTSQINSHNRDMFAVKGSPSQILLQNVHWPHRPQAATSKTRTKAQLKKNLHKSPMKQRGAVTIGSHPPQPNPLLQTSCVEGNPTNIPKPPGDEIIQNTPRIPKVRLKRQDKSSLYKVELCEDFSDTANRDNTMPSLLMENSVSLTNSRSPSDNYPTLTPQHNTDYTISNADHIQKPSPVSEREVNSTKSTSQIIDQDEDTQGYPIDDEDNDKTVMNSNLDVTQESKTTLHETPPEQSILCENSAFNISLKSLTSVTEKVSVETNVPVSLYKCQHCGKKYKVLRHFKLHETKHTDSRVVSKKSIFFQKTKSNKKQNGSRPDKEQPTAKFCSKPNHGNTIFSLSQKNLTGYKKKNLSRLKSANNKLQNLITVESKTNDSLDVYSFCDDPDSDNIPSKKMLHSPKYIPSKIIDHGTVSHIRTNIMPNQEFSDTSKLITKNTKCDSKCSESEQSGVVNASSEDKSFSGEAKKVNSGIINKRNCSKRFNVRPKGWRAKTLQRVNHEIKLCKTLTVCLPRVADQILMKDKSIALPITENKLCAVGKFKSSEENVISKQSLLENTSDCKKYVPEYFKSSDTLAFGAANGSSENSSKGTLQSISKGTVTMADSVSKSSCHPPKEINKKKKRCGNKLFNNRPKGKRCKRKTPVKKKKDSSSNLINTPSSGIVNESVSLRNEKQIVTEQILPENASKDSGDPSCVEFHSSHHDCEKIAQSKNTDEALKSILTDSNNSENDTRDSAVVSGTNHKLKGNSKITDNLKIKETEIASQCEQGSNLTPANDSLVVPNPSLEPNISEGIQFGNTFKLPIVSACSPHVAEYIPAGDPRLVPVNPSAEDTEDDIGYHSSGSCESHDHGIMNHNRALVSYARLQEAFKSELAKQAEFEKCLDSQNSDTILVPSPQNFQETRSRSFMDALLKVSGDQSDSSEQATNKGTMVPASLSVQTSSQDTLLGVSEDQSKLAEQATNERTMPMVPTSLSVQTSYQDASLKVSGDQSESAKQTTNKGAVVPASLSLRASFRNVLLEVSGDQSKTAEQATNKGTMVPASLSVQTSYQSPKNQQDSIREESPRQDSVGLSEKVSTPKTPQFNRSFLDSFLPSSGVTEVTNSLTTDSKCLPTLTGQATIKQEIPDNQPTSSPSTIGAKKSFPNFSTIGAKKSFSNFAAKLNKFKLKVKGSDESSVVASNQFEVIGVCPINQNDEQTIDIDKPAAPASRSDSGIYEASETEMEPDCVNLLDEYRTVGKNRKASARKRKSSGRSLGRCSKNFRSDTNVENIVGTSQISAPISPRSLWDALESEFNQEKTSPSINSFHSSEDLAFSPGLGSAPFHGMPFHVDPPSPADGLPRLRSHAKNQCGSHFNSPHSQGQSLLNHQGIINIEPLKPDSEYSSGHTDTGFDHTGFSDQDYLFQDTLMFPNTSHRLDEVQKPPISKTRGAGTAKQMMLREQLFSSAKVVLEKRSNIVGEDDHCHTDDCLYKGCQL